MPTTTTNARNGGEAMLAGLRRVFRFGKDEFAITTSIGIARAPDDGERPQQLIQNADTAMYDSKRRTRNGWQAFTPELARRQQDRLQIETQLRRAVDNQEFRLVYQPQVDLRNGRIVAAEALIRWQNHRNWANAPGPFISHAETTGDIVRIGSGCCAKPAAGARAGATGPGHRARGGERVLPPVRWRRPGQTTCARAAGVRPARLALELEFTERVLIEDAAATLRAFAELRRWA
jgi:predicted signal transduction protein with EAL and GGDEF domain